MRTEAEIQKEADLKEKSFLKTFKEVSDINMQVFAKEGDVKSSPKDSKLKKELQELQKKQKLLQLALDNLNERREALDKEMKESEAYYKALNEFSESRNEYKSICLTYQKELKSYLGKITKIDAEMDKLERVAESTVGKGENPQALGVLQKTADSLWSEAQKLQKECHDYKHSDGKKIAQLRTVNCKVKLTQDHAKPIYAVFFEGTEASKDATDAVHRFDALFDEVKVAHKIVSGMLHGGTIDASAALTTAQELATACTILQKELEEIVRTLLKAAGSIESSGNAEQAKLLLDKFREGKAAYVRTVEALRRRMQRGLKQIPQEFRTSRSLKGAMDQIRLVGIAIVKFDKAVEQLDSRVVTAVKAFSI